MVDFNALRARKGTNFTALTAKLEATGQNGSYKKDERIWKPTANKDGISSSIVRLLPIPYVDEVAAEKGEIQASDLTPMATIIKHAFQGSNGWYIENSLRTFGEQCPVYAQDGPIWGLAKKNNDKLLQDQLKKRLPSTFYYANVLIIKDGTNPANNGKVMIWDFGQKVRDLIEQANKPKFDTDTPFDPFDMFEGANMILNLTYTKKKIGDKEVNVPDYSAAKWAPQSPLADGDEAEMERIWKESHSIAEFYNRKHFKSFDELTTKYLKVMGSKAGGLVDKPKSADDMLKEMTGDVKEAKPAEAPSTPAPSAGKVADSKEPDMSEFERMIAEMG